jgi:putative endonuclease
MFYVYILKCSDGGGYYTRCTNNLDDRLNRHNRGYVEATKDRVPVKIIFIVRLLINLKHFNLKNILSRVPVLPLEINIYYKMCGFLLR